MVREDTVSAELQALLDREAIRDIARLYCHYMWQHDMRVVDLYTDDGRFGENQGRAELLAMYERSFAGALDPHPFAGNHVIELDGPDHATGFCYNDLRIKRDGTRTLAIGFWRDDYAKVDGAWKFRDRQFTFYDEASIAGDPD